jgi:hypothetical protein
MSGKPAIACLHQDVRRLCLTGCGIAHAHYAVFGMALQLHFHTQLLNRDGFGQPDRVHVHLL